MRVVLFNEAIRSGLQFAIAALIGFIFYIHYDLVFGFWCVITIAAVLQPTVKMTTDKALMRLLGTLIGVLVSYAAVLIIRYHPELTLICFFLSMLVSSLFLFYLPKHSYLGIVTGITSIIILTSFDQKPFLYHAVIYNRTLDVIMGILIAWFASSFIFPASQVSSLQVNPVLEIKTPGLDAILMALATTLSLLPWFYLHYQGGFWAPIACLFTIGEQINTTYKKSVDYLLAHLIVMLIAAVLSFSFDTVYGLGISLIVGMFVFGYWMRKPILKFDYTIANAMAVVYCVILLINPGSVNTLNTILARLLNTMLGISIALLLVFIKRATTLCD